MHVCMYDKGTLNPHRVVEGHLGLATIPTSTTILAQAAVGGASTLARAKTITQAFGELYDIQVGTKSAVPAATLNTILQAWQAASSAA